MAKLKRLNRSDRAKYNAKFGDVVREISKSSGIITAKSGKTFAINDSADAPISGLKIYGRTDQVKTTGANLFDVHTVEWSSSNNRANVEVLEDGTARVSVAKTSDFISTICSFIDMTKVEGSTVYLSMDVKGGSEGNQPAAMLRAVNSETGASSNLLASSLKPTNKKISGKVAISDSVRNTYDTLGLILYYNASATSGWEVGSYVDFSNIMISTSDVPFEPYTGLAPSPSPEYPQAMNSVAEGGSVEVCVHGKNLFNINDVYRTTYVDYRVEDNKLIFTKTNTGTNQYSNFFFDLGAYNEFRNKTLTISITNEFSKVLNAQLVYRAKDVLYTSEPLVRLGAIKANDTTIYTVTVPENDIEGIMCLRITSPDTTVTDEEYTLSNIQVEHGTQATEYKPFNKKTAIFSTPNGLLGIPVESGGNYTDVNGQQWICDEVDLESQELIKRVKKKTFTGDEKWEYTTQSSSGVELCYIVLTDGKNEGAYDEFFMCNYARVAKTSWTNPANVGMAAETNSKRMQIGFILDIGTYGSAKAWRSKVAELYNSGKPIEIVYALEKPIKTALTSKEITAYKTLKTHKPTTIVSNDAGAIVELLYYADKKNYIDQKFAELQALALENK